MMAAYRTLSNRGTYILVGHTNRPMDIAVGRLGQLKGAPGFYAYVGSAFGKGGIKSRIRHHLRPVARPHWHFDYLHDHLTVTQIWFCLDSCSREHDWARILRLLPGSRVPLAGFGASDCTCVSHLVCWPVAPSVYRFRRRARQQIDGQGPIPMLAVPSDPVRHDFP